MPESKPTLTTVAIEGEQNIETAHELLHRLREYLMAEGGLAVDLSNLSVCDTALLQLVYSLRRTAQARGKAFRLAGLSPAFEAAAAAHGLRIEELSSAEGNSDNAA